MDAFERRVYIRAFHQLGSIDDMQQWTTESITRHMHEVKDELVHRIELLDSTQP